MNHLFLISLLLLSLLTNPLPAQEPPKPRYTSAAAWSFKPTAAVSGRGVYLAGAGHFAIYYERNFKRFVGVGTGVCYMIDGYGSSIGVPLFVQLNAFTKRYRGLSLRGGAILQHGLQPFALPYFEFRGRVGFGKSNWFIEPHFLFVEAYYYGCANGTYTCPGGPFKRGVWGGQIAGIGLSVGRYNRVKG